MISGRSLVAIYLLFCGAMLFALWTLAYGLGLALFFRDGRILSLVISSDPFAPIKQLWTYRDVAILQTVALGALAVSATVTGLLDSLERRGYIQRQPHASDRRMLLIALTDSGRAVAQQFREVVHRHQREWLSALSEREQKQLLATLHRLQGVLGEAEE